MAWARLGEVPELRDLVEEIDLERDGQMFLAAITTAPADEAQLPLAELSRLAGHRATAWFNGHGDLWATLAAAVSVAGVLTSAATTLESEDFDVEQYVQELGAAADALLKEG
ncbi:MAG: hypothetical protein HYX34_01075 [Actinobacteria bacterium]|nr:hypothetical protein [Actinomycetota bacterium]